MSRWPKLISIEGLISGSLQPLSRETHLSFPPRMYRTSIFSATSAYRGEPPPVSVRLSALTTAASFGVLALSGIPVVKALGMTVAAIVLAALAMIELEQLAALRRRSG